MKEKILKLIKTNAFIYTLLIVSILVISFGVAYALLTDKDEKVNEFTPSNNEVEIVEPKIDKPKELIPGSVIGKKPSVKNIGNENVYVRARVLFSDNRAEEFCEELDINPNWIKVGEWYYYRHVLLVGNSTPPIFTEVKIKDSTDQNEIINFDIIITIDSVNSENYSNYSDAFGI
jgi:hypothetical protein